LTARTAGIRFTNRWPRELILPRQIEVQDLATEEQQRRKGLAMRRRENAALAGEMGEEPLDIRRPHIPGMPQSVPTHERLHPMDIGLLRS